MNTGRLFTLGRQASRIAPVEIRDAVGEYARTVGCPGGDVVWRDALSCWEVRLELPGNDPRHAKERHESVLLHEWISPDPRHPGYPSHDLKLLEKLRRHPRTNQRLPGYVALELDDLGVGGIREILEKGSLFSGRGEYKDMEHAMRAVAKRERARRASQFHDKRQRARDVATATRRRILKIPFLPVGIDLGKRKRA